MNEFEFIFRPAVGGYETKIVKKYEEVNGQSELETLCREIMMALEACGFQTESIIDMFYALGHEK
jgi:glutamine synthetase